MSVRNGIALLVAVFSLAFLAGCGGNGATITKPIPPPTGSFNQSMLNGTYVFSVSGADFQGAPLAAVGTLTANGSGGITGGAVDINDAVSGPSPNLTIGGSSSYNVGLDGRGRATLTVSGGTVILDFVLTSSAHGLVIELDGNASGSGTLDLQTAGVTPTGPYAFILSGASTAGSPWATVGNFTLSGATLAGTDDFNEGGNIPFTAQTLTGNFALGPSATPSTTLTTTTSGAASGFNTLTFDVFAVDATHLKFIEMDSTAILSGDAFSEPSTAMPTGTLAFTMAGELSGGAFASGGFMTLTGTTVTGSEDFASSTGTSTQSTPATFSATLTSDSTHAGRFTFGSFGTFFPSNPTYAAYPSSGGLLLLEIDASGIATGAAYTQTAPVPTFASAQGYGLNLSGFNLTSTVEVDDIAEFTAGSNGTVTSGIIDENYPGANPPLFDLALSNGTYGTIDSLGRFGLSANAGNSNISTLNTGFALTFYAVDGTTFPFIELDGGQVSTGVIVLQNPSAAPSAAAAQAQMFIARPPIRAHANWQKKN
jgi:hypothetical protein